jgi:hypothetical protein
MTPLKSKNGRQVIRIERTTTEKLNSDRVHYIAGGTYMGIIINRAVNGQFFTFSLISRQQHLFRHSMNSNIA